MRIHQLGFWYLEKIVAKKEITCNQVPVGTNDGCAVGFGVGVWDGSDVGLTVGTRVGLAEGTKEGFPTIFSNKNCQNKGQYFQLYFFWI